MPNIKGWSRNEVSTLAGLLNLNTSFVGYGYVVNSSISEGTVVNGGTLEVELEVKYKKEEETNSTKEDKKKQ